MKTTKPFCVNRKIHTRPLTPADAEDLQQLMFRIFPPAYAYLWDDGGHWYVRNVYDPALVREELGDERVRACFIYLAEAARPVGYFKTVQGQGPDGPDPAYWYIHRLYLGPEARGRGIGSRLMRDTLAAARAAGCRRSWLETMDTAPACDFYRAFGFRETRSIQLPYEGILPGFRTLLTLEKDLD